MALIKGVFMIISKHKVVKMKYILKNKNGDVIYSSTDEEPLHYIHGIGMLVPGLEKTLESKTIGDSFDVEISPSEGYGDYQKDNIQTAPLDSFQGTGDLNVGMQIQVDMPNGNSIGTITSINEGNVTFDLNHPLAGQTLYFDIDVLDVRDATAEELDHGHVHGPGCNHH